MRSHAGDVRTPLESLHLKGDWEKNPLPHRGLEPASAPRLACLLDILLTELFPLHDGDKDNAEETETIPKHLGYSRVTSGKNSHLLKCWSEWKAFGELGLKPDNYSVRMLLYSLTSDRSMATPALFCTRMVPVLLQDSSNSHCLWIHCISQGVNRNAHTQKKNGSKFQTGRAASEL